MRSVSFNAVTQIHDHDPSDGQVRRGLISDFGHLDELFGSDSDDDDNENLSLGLARFLFGSNNSRTRFPEHRMRNTKDLLQYLSSHLERGEPSKLEVKLTQEQQKQLTEEKEMSELNHLFLNHLYSELPNISSSPGSDEIKKIINTAAEILNKTPAQIQSIADVDDKFQLLTYFVNHPEEAKPYAKFSAEKLCTLAKMVKKKNDSNVLASQGPPASLLVGNDNNVPASASSRTSALTG